MAKVRGIYIPDELRPSYNRNLQQRDRYFQGVVQGQRRILSRREVRELRRPARIASPMVGRGSLFKFLSPYWRNLTSQQKQIWGQAAQHSSLNGWQLFISDNAARIREDLNFPLPPSEKWQVRTGALKIEAPSDGIILKQEHPLDYFVARKVAGRPWKLEPVLIKESFSLPLTLEISYKSNLTINPNYNENSQGKRRARYLAEIWTSYQGQDEYAEIEIPFQQQTDWTRASGDNLKIRGHIISYNLKLEIVGFYGEVLFDNIRAIHSGQNWARDPRCDDITKEFTKGLALVPPFWIPLLLPNGSTFSTVYPFRNN